MIQPAPKKSGGLFTVIDARSYMPGGVFREVEYRDSLRNEDWSRFKDQRILVKGCGRAPVPPWAYMLLLSYLGNYPKIVAYGEECAPIVVHRRKDMSREEEEALVKEAASTAAA